MRTAAKDIVREHSFFIIIMGRNKIICLLISRKWNKLVSGGNTENIMMKRKRGQ